MADGEFVAVVARRVAFVPGDANVHAPPVCVGDGEGHVSRVIVRESESVVVGAEGANVSNIDRAVGRGLVR